VQSLNFRIFYF
jgi:hypothetical protein